MEYFIFHAANILCKVNNGYSTKNITIFTAKFFSDNFQHIPTSVLPEFRKKRQYVSSILSKNEVGRDGPYNRKIFRRVKKGCYIINPDLKVKISDEWLSLFNVQEDDKAP